MSSLLRDVELRELGRVEQIEEDEAHRLVREERLRLARELHDIVSFGFATIAVQAGVAVHVAESRPEQAVDALQAIRTASRDVLDDLRMVLEQLREDDDAAEPARGIGQLGGLVESVACAGVDASVLVLGRPRPVPLEVDRTVYRIVQEALANVLRHAPGATAVITVSYERGYLDVTIQNDRTSDPGNHDDEGSGYGIVGMSERAQALGGHVEAGPVPGRGFRVRAIVPFRARP